MSAKCECPECGDLFDPNNHPVTKAAASGAGAASGAYLGSSLGVAGPWGAVAGTVPGAVIGGATGYVLQDQFTRCPGCEAVFKY